jgi:hypothetical protein
MRIRATFSIAAAGILIVCTASFLPPDALHGSRRSAAHSVTEYHNSPRRDGVYVDPTMTKASAVAFHIDPKFRAKIGGAIYAQLLYVSGRAGGRIFVAADNEMKVFVRSAK